CQSSLARRATSMNRVSSEVNNASPPSAPDDLPITAEAPTQEETEELLREHDASSRVRTGLGWWAWLIAIASVALSLFHLYTGIYGARPSLVQGAIHVGGATSIIFLLYPVSKRSSRKRGVPWYDAVLAAAGLGANLYIVAEYRHLTSNLVQILGYREIDYIIAALG